MAGLLKESASFRERFERTKHLMQSGGEHSLAEIAAPAGFSDQSPFSHHFKRLVGVTPRRFRMSARIAQNTASPAKRPESDPRTILNEQGD
jgi:AraC-like DNA-binding protein